MMTTFNTPFGRYRYLRLPMGAHHRKSSTVYQCLENSTWTIIVWGSTIEQHDERLEAVKKLYKWGCVSTRLNATSRIGTSQGVNPIPCKQSATNPEPRAYMSRFRLYRFGEREGLVKRVQHCWSSDAQKPMKDEIQQKYPELFKGNGTLVATTSEVQLHPQLARHPFIRSKGRVNRCHPCSSSSGFCEATQTQGRAGPTDEVGKGWMRHILQVTWPR